MKSFPAFSFHQDGTRFIINMAEDEIFCEYFQERATRFLKSFGDTVLLQKKNSDQGIINFEIDCGLSSDMQYVEPFLGSIQNYFMPVQQISGWEGPQAPSPFWEDKG